MIILRDVAKEYRVGDSQLAALNGVELEISEAEFVAVMGPSGCGKSTLLFTVGGLLSPTKGHVLVRGRDIYKMSRNERAKFIRTNIGFIFQSFELLPYLTALENVALSLYLSETPPSEHYAMAKGALERVGLFGRALHKPSQLSGGEQQRVAIARAIVKKPPVLLADEPTGNLDQKTGDEIVQLLLELNHKERLTTILVTHDPAKAKMADRRLTMVDGKMIGGESS